MRMNVYLKYWPTLVGFCWFLRCISRMWPPKREKKRHQNKNKKQIHSKWHLFTNFCLCIFYDLFSHFFLAVFLVWLNFQCFFSVEDFVFVFFYYFRELCIGREAKTCAYLSIHPSVRPISFLAWLSVCLSVRSYS